MPTLHINLTRIEHNTRIIAVLLEPLGIRLVGVTKACLGNERVAAAMLAGGAAALADSRLENIANLRRHLPEVDLELLRTPVAGKIPAPGADLFFVSSVLQARALLGLGLPGPVRFCLMVETGDGREGVPVKLAPREAKQLASLEGAALAGLATNAACARPGAPLAEAMTAFADAVRSVADAGVLYSAAGSTDPLPPFLSSVGGSGLLRLLLDADSEEQAVPGGQAPFGPATELRCGEAILLGRVPAGGPPALYVPGAHRDAFILEAPVLELFEKNGFPQALLGFGVQDVGHAPLMSLTEGVSPDKITSDYFVVNCTPGAAASLRIGSSLSFLLPYYGLLAAMTSPFVEKRYAKE